jgi:hypothetical protein
MYTNMHSPGQPRPSASETPSQETPKHVTDRLGDYVDFEEVK